VALSLCKSRISREQSKYDEGLRDGIYKRTDNDFSYLSLVLEYIKRAKTGN
jgi:hypothetical protein